MFRAARHRHVLRGDEISLADQRRMRGSLEMTQPRRGFRRCTWLCPGVVPAGSARIARTAAGSVPSVLCTRGWPGSRPPSAAGFRPGPPPAGTAPRTRTDLLTIEGRRLTAWIADHFLKPDPSRFSGSSGVPRLANSAPQITRSACLKWTRPKRPLHYILADPSASSHDCRVNCGLRSADRRGRRSRSRDSASGIVDACGPGSPDSHPVVWGLTSRPPVPPAGFPPVSRLPAGFSPIARLPLVSRRPAFSGSSPSAVARFRFPFGVPPGSPSPGQSSR